MCGLAAYIFAAVYTMSFLSGCWGGSCPPLLEATLAALGLGGVLGSDQLLEGVDVGLGVLDGLLLPCKLGVELRDGALQLEIG